MRRLADNIATLILFYMYLLGVVLAKGTMETICALIPPYAWYLSVQRYAVLWHLV